MSKWRVGKYTCADRADAGIEFDGTSRRVVERVKWALTFGPRARYSPVGNTVSEHLENLPPPAKGLALLSPLGKLVKFFSRS